MLRLLISVALALLLAGPAVAGDLGEVRVPMPQGSQGDAARQAALQQGLKQVIARLTGRAPAQVAGLPGVAGALATPDTWLLRYGYESGEPPVLLARFDADALAGYLAGQGVAVWSGPRPPVLVWLVAGGSGQGRMVRAGGPLADEIQAAARRLGLEIVLPKWDEQDRAAVTVADIRGHFDGPLLQASQRYAVDWVATGVIYGTARRPIINWRLINDGADVADQRTRAASGEAAAVALVEGIGAALVARYRVAVVGGPGEAERVRVRGVATLEGWVALHRQLLDLGAIRAVRLRRADGDTLTLAVGFAGTRTELARALNRLPGLRGCRSEAAAPAATAPAAARMDAAPVPAPSPAPAPVTVCER